MPPSNNVAQSDYFSLPAPAELCQGSASRRYRLVFAEDLDPSEWNDQPTRPISPSALREL
jgi:hypothetical protein